MPTQINYNYVCKKLEDEFGIAPDERVALKQWIVDLVTEETENEAARWREEVVQARSERDKAILEVSHNKEKMAGFDRLVDELKEIKVLRECCTKCGAFQDMGGKCDCAAGMGWRIDGEKIKP